jgi:hypothetical protein
VAIYRLPPCRPFNSRPFSTSEPAYAHRRRQGCLNLLDLPAEIISLIYRFRWTIELFFRFFKQILGCRHLFFHSQNGIELQTYCAIIACMLLCLWTGRKPTKRTYEMVCYYFLGLASETELLAHLQKLKEKDAAPRPV